MGELLKCDWIPHAWNILISGATGSGKNSVASCIATAAIRAGPLAAAVNAEARRQATDQARGMGGRAIPRPAGLPVNRRLDLQGGIGVAQLQGARCARGERAVEIAAGQQVDILAPLDPLCEGTAISTADELGDEAESDMMTALPGSGAAYPALMTGPKSRAADDLPDAAGKADIVSAAATARQPVLMGDWMRPGTHVDQIGELMQPTRSGAITPDHVQGNRYDLMAAGRSSRQSDDQITSLKDGGDAHPTITADVVEAVRSARSSWAGHAYRWPIRMRCWSSMVSRKSE